MLHLLPIRILLTAFAAAMGLLIFLAFYAGQVSADKTLLSLQIIVRWASFASVGAIIVLYAGWRWVPIIETAVYPYLGGKWEGEVRYQDADNQSCSKPVVMEVKHTLLGIKLLLDSDESTSQTLAVHAEKDPDFERFRLFYIYLNQRKEGVVGAGEIYRGLAVVRCLTENGLSIEGDYFTDTHRRGTLHLLRTERTAFWKLWR